MSYKNPGCLGFIFNLLGIKPKNEDRSTFMSYNNKISLKHVDYLLCTKRELKPVCGIELDDSSHKRQDRIERDAFVEKVFKVAGLQLVRFQNKKTYTLQEVQDRLSLVIEKESDNSDNLYKKSSEVYILGEELYERQEIKLEEQTPICMKCGTPMVLRTSKKGTNKGVEFYGCSNYPKCREIVKVE